MKVYGLFGSADALPFYIGATNRPLAERLRMHRVNAKRRLHLPIAQRIVAGDVEIRLLALSDDPDAEERWIRRFLEAGANLLNETPDGLMFNERRLRDTERAQRVFSREGEVE